MQFRLGAKLVILFVLSLGFAIPFVIIDAVTNERRQYRDRAVAEIAQSSAGSQRIVGPVLVLPYRQRIATRPDTGRGSAVRVISDAVVVLPAKLGVDANAVLEERYRGIYKSHLYRADCGLVGEFVIPERLEVPREGEIEWEPAYVAVGVSDPRGMRRPPTLEWDGSVREAQPGARLFWLGSGFSASLADLNRSNAGRRIPFAVTLPLIGTQSLHLVPMGRETRVRLRSPWRHPSFTGRYLPDVRSVGAEGFRAEWQLSHYATDVERVVEAAHNMLGRDGYGSQALEQAQPGGRTDTRSGREQVFDASLLGVEFIDPVDVYRLSQRALKYGMLFVLLTFVGFFLFEVLRALAVHPVQYGLVGAALAIFFLLLVSLSEHLRFGVAYAIASAACVALLVVYVSHMLRGWNRGLGFGAGLGSLYALLFVVLRSEDYALLLGAILLFAVLAFVMVATRKVDWYRVGEPVRGGSASAGPPA